MIIDETAVAIRPDFSRFASDVRTFGRNLGSRFSDEFDRSAQLEPPPSARADFEREGRRLGEAAGRETGDGFAREAESGIVGPLKGIAEKAAAAFAAGLAAAGVGSILADTLNIDAANDKLAAQLGATGPQAAELGKVAGELYAGAWGDSIDQVNEAIRSVINNIGDTGPAEDSLKTISASVLDVATTFDQELGGVTRAVGQLMKTGLAKDANDALDIVTAGFQGGVDKAEDFLDTLNEYGTQFRKLGLSGQIATGLLTQGLQAGARDADIVADALKEFSIRAIDGSDATAAGFKSLGLNAKEMSEQIAKGGKPASAGLQLVLDKLRAIHDPVKREAAAVALFGSQAEDLGQALFALDPSSAVDALGQVDGAAARMGQTLNDNAKTNLTSFWRQVNQTFVQLIGGRVLPVISEVAATLATQFGPALDAVGAFLQDPVIPGLRDLADFMQRNATVISIVAGLIAAVFIPHLIALGVTATVAKAKVVASWIAQQVASVRAAAAHSVAVVKMVAGWVAMGLAALRSGAQTVAIWTLYRLEAVKSTAATVAQLARQATAFVVQKTVMLASATAAKVVTAAQWLLNAALTANPIGLVIVALVALGAGLVLLWQKSETFRSIVLAVWSAVKSGTGDAIAFILRAMRGWLSFWLTVAGGIVHAAAAALGWIPGLGPKLKAADRAFATMKDGILAKMDELADKADAFGEEIPKGMAAGITRSRWRAIEATTKMTGQMLRSAKRDLGVASPSRVFAELADDINRGIALGLDRTADLGPARLAEIVATMAKPLQTPLPALAGTSVAAPGASAPPGTLPGVSGPQFISHVTVHGTDKPERTAAEVVLGQRRAVSQPWFQTLGQPS